MSLIHAGRIQAAPNQYIALVGYAGAGKDVLAAHLIRNGYVRHNYGDFIKQFFDPFTSGVEHPHELQACMLANLTTGKVEGDVYAFIDKYAQPYYVAEHTISAFTENRSHKPYIREILEHGGELIYDMVQRIYNQRLEHLLAEGENVINTRLCQLSEAAHSAAYGHTVYLIERSNWAPTTDWDAQVVADLEDGGYIHHTIYNDASSGEEWEAQSREYVYHNILYPTGGASAA